MAHANTLQMKIQQEEREVGMYGCTAAHLDEEIARWMTVTPPALMAMSIISDVQELLTRQALPADREHMRQMLNRAKYMINRANEK